MGIVCLAYRLVARYWNEWNEEGDDDDGDHQYQYRNYLLPLPRISGQSSKIKHIQ